MTKTMQDKPKVLFVCTGNSCRSQMAEGLLKHYGNGEFEVYSAGLRPSYVHPLAIKAMAELDIDITNQYSKTINEFIGQEFSYVITVCGSAKGIIGMKVLAEGVIRNEAEKAIEYVNSLSFIGSFIIMLNISLQHLKRGKRLIDA